MPAVEALDGKVAVVTGGGSGIGRALCRRLVAEGMAVVVADRNLAAAEGVAAELDEAVAVRCDVSLAEDVDALRDTTLERFGSFHVVCNNAGVLVTGVAWETSVEDWRWLLGVNLWGVIHGVRAFVPVLLEQGEGHVVNIASLAGLTSNPALAAYNVSKHAVVTFSETLVRDLELSGATGVGVSVVCPGFVETALMAAERTHDAASQVGSAVGQLMVAGVQGGMAPDAVAAATVDAVRHRRFYVHTHPEARDLVAARHAEVLAGFTPVTPEGAG